MKFKSIIIAIGLLSYMTYGFKFMSSRKPQPFIGFELNQSDIDTCNKSDLEFGLSFFEKYPNGLIELGGYSGPFEDSTVAIQRAESVRDFYRNHGVSSECFQIQNMGQTKPKINLEYQANFENCNLRKEALMGNRLVTFSILSFNDKTE